MIIYKTTNLVNKKFYIGKSIFDKPSYLGGGSLIKKAIKKYNRDNFKKEIIEECDSIEELNNREQYWIKELNAQNLEIGYNLKPGGEGGAHSDLTKQKMKELALKRPREFYENTERSKKLSESKKGKKLTEEHKRKMREWHSQNREKKPKIPHQLLLFTGHTGRKHTIEFKEKISELNKGTKNFNSKKYTVKNPNGKLYYFDDRNSLVLFFKNINKNIENTRKMISPHNLIRDGENKGWYVTSVRRQEEVK